MGSELGDRLNLITYFCRALGDRMGFLLFEERLEFFGLNGKSCTDKMFSNFIVDIFPATGDLKMNALSYKQLHGELFNKTISNVLFNTEGGSETKIGSFIRYGIDLSEDFKKKFFPKTMSVVTLFLWHVPSDLKQVLDKFTIRLFMIL
jgi:hypothetical protein